MKSLLCVFALLLSFALVPILALADLPAPKSIH